MRFGVQVETNADEFETCAGINEIEDFSVVFSDFFAF